MAVSTAAVLGFTGRLLLASLFIMSGVMKVAHHEEPGKGPFVAYMAPKMDAVLDRLQQSTGVRVPLQQATYPLLVLAAGCMELLGGVLFTLNLKLGAVLLMLFLVPTSLVMHNFWELEHGSPAQQIEYINFMKNLCLFGAFLMFLSLPRQAAPAKYKVH
ncbi:HR-like lesion-inducer [Scenedesmus sp. NREL 46B-D3]|nr:HR-like lesion-inducer [Scenedesmus sp. NREL 46B-D3]